MCCSYNYYYFITYFKFYNCTFIVVYIAIIRCAKYGDNNRKIRSSIPSMHFITIQLCLNFKKLIVNTSWALITEIKLFFCKNLLVGSSPKNQLHPLTSFPFHPFSKYPTSFSTGSLQRRSQNKPLLGCSWNLSIFFKSSSYNIYLSNKLLFLTPVKCLHATRWISHLQHKKVGTNRMNP